MFGTTCAFPKVLRRDQLRRKNGEEELGESEPRGAVPMKRPASNRGRGGKGRGRGKAAKKEVGEEGSVPGEGEGEDSGPVGPNPDEPKDVEDGNPEEKGGEGEKGKITGKRKAKAKAKAKVMASPKAKVKSTPKKKKAPKSPQDI